MEIEEECTSFWVEKCDAVFTSNNSIGALNLMTRSFEDEQE
jgi:hypothetical protein